MFKRKRNRLYPGCALTGTLPHGRRDYDDMRYAKSYGSRECEIRCEYVMGRTNAVCDDYANTLWAARMRYVICEHAMGRADTICDTQIGYGPRECDMQFANTLWAARIRYEQREFDLRYANRLRAICECAMAARMRYAIC